MLVFDPKTGGICSVYLSSYECLLTKVSEYVPCGEASRE